MPAPLDPPVNLPTGGRAEVAWVGPAIPRGVVVLLGMAAVAIIAAACARWPG